MGKNYSFKLQFNGVWHFMAYLLTLNF